MASASRRRPARRKTTAAASRQRRHCNPNGKTGVSPRVLADITRNNLFGREQSASLRGTYGLLEQKINLLFQNPHFEGNRNFGLTFPAATPTAWM